MKNIEEIYDIRKYEIGIMQFGEGNFLRGFVDYMVDIANESGVMSEGIVVVKAIASGDLEAFKEQRGLYTVSLRGKKSGDIVKENYVVRSIQRVIDCGSEYEDFLKLAHLETLKIIISNTTEAGIMLDENDKFSLIPPVSYPGKLTRFLFERFTAFSGDINRGLIILPVELIEANGKKLKYCVETLAKIWSLGDDFIKWLSSACTFCSTLVDRIVTGFPKDDIAPYYQELGYSDKLFDIAEPFGLWVIESERDISAKFPLHRAGMPVIFTNDQTPYRERKVRILNGAHTGTVLAAFLMGKDTVLDCMEDKTIRKFMENLVLCEIVPTVNLPYEEAKAFALSVFERFENPFVKHALLSISLNSISKWRARILPSLQDSFNAAGHLPSLLTFSFAALLAFYTIEKSSDGKFYGTRSGEHYQVQDSAEILEFFSEKCTLPVSDYVSSVASNVLFWGEDLTQIPWFSSLVTSYLSSIRDNNTGMRSAMEFILQ